MACLGPWRVFLVGMYWIVILVRDEKTNDLTKEFLTPHKLGLASDPKNQQSTLGQSGCLPPHQPLSKSSS